MLDWPRTFRKLIAKLSFFNFNFLTLPATACATPRVPLLDDVNGIALASALLLTYIVLLWAVARLLMKRMHFPQEKIVAFDRKTVQRYVTMLQLTYAPVVEGVLSIFNCRSIATDAYLREDVSQGESEVWMLCVLRLRAPAAPVPVCYTANHVSYERAAIFWIIVFVRARAGVDGPVFGSNLPCRSSAHRQHSPRCSTSIIFPSWLAS